MIDFHEKPLISFVLLAYNQERFIREAVEGALAQTYEPLEIILSDDFSKDNTFEIIKKVAAAYQGPHKVILNRNATNLGIGNHVNRIVEMANGNLIVGAAGDDFSVPTRTQELYEAWIASNSKACSLVSGYELIDEDGKTLSVNNSVKKADEEDIINRAKFGPNILGATHAFTKDTFRVFGPLNSDCSAEDIIIGFRSYLLGPVIEVLRPLVKYRRHGNSISNRPCAGKVSLQKHADILVNAMNLNISTRLQMIRDATNKSVAVNESDRMRVICILSQRLAYYIKIKKGLQGSNLKKHSTLLCYRIREKFFRIYLRGFNKINDRKSHKKTIA